MTREAKDNDPRVSETYRELATETTPPALDKRILSMAAAPRRPAFGLSRAWFRPLAWTATIGLSLAFVLEMSQLDDATEPTAYTDADLLIEEASSRQTVDALEKRVVADEAVRESIEPARQLQEPQLRSDAVAEKKASPAPAAAEVTPGGTGASVSQDFAATDMSLLREAEEQARSRAGSIQAVVVNETAAFAAKKEHLVLCDDDARRTAASWYECIEELREQHLDEAAALELEALLVGFPDFEVPGRDK